MNTTDVQLPPRTTSPDGWQDDDGDRNYRIFNGADRWVDGVGVIGTSAVQFEDGSIDLSTQDGPRIWLGLGGDGISVAQARQVAAEIAAAVAEVESWRTIGAP